MRPRRDAFKPASRADDRPPAQPQRGWTKQELLDACDLSPKTFDTLRKAARVRGPSHGGLSWLFSLEDVQALIHRARSGSFTIVGPAAADAWERLIQEPAD